MRERLFACLERMQFRPNRVLAGVFVISMLERGFGVLDMGGGRDKGLGRLVGGVSRGGCFDCLARVTHLLHRRVDAAAHCEHDQRQDAEVAH